MPSEWAAIDGLIRELGATVAAATYVRGAIAQATAAQAIHEASLAVHETITDPGSERLLEAARDAIETAKDVVVALDADVARSHGLARRSVELRGRARARQAGAAGTRGTEVALAADS